MRIGESLFTVFSSLAKAILFVIKLQNYQVLTFKGHGTSNCPKEFDSEVLNTFLLRGGFAKKHELISAFATQKCSNFSNIAFNMTPIGLTISSITRS